jgi:hypothetical protein
MDIKARQANCGCKLMTGPTGDLQTRHWLAYSAIRERKSSKEIAVWFRMAFHAVHCGY